MGDQVTFKLLSPGHGSVDVDGLFAEWDPQAPEGSDRPRVAINFAVTADGSATLADGKSGGIGDEGDLAVFRGLRDRVDAVMAGPTTIAVEGYRRLIRDEARRAERVGRGLIADPLAVTISRSGVVPLTAPIFGDPDQRSIAFVPAGKASGNTPPGLEEVGLDSVTPAAALEHLAGLGVRSVLCEGGPKLVSALAAGDLIDDVFLTISPKFAGGNESGVTTGPPLASTIDFELAHVAERQGSLFIRWTRPGG